KTRPPAREPWWPWSIAPSHPRKRRPLRPRRSVPFTKHYRKPAAASAAELRQLRIEFLHDFAADLFAERTVAGDRCPRGTQAGARFGQALRLVHGSRCHRLFCLGFGLRAES